MSRSRLVLAVASLVFTLATLLSLASVATQLERPWPGFAVWSNLVVPAIGTDDWPGIRAGVPLRSVLVAADGAPLRDAAHLRALVALAPPGTAIAYTFARDGERRIVEVPTGVLRWRDTLPAGSSAPPSRPGMPVATGGGECERGTCSHRAGRVRSGAACTLV